MSVIGNMKRGLMQITIGREFSTRHMAEVSRKYGVPVTGRLSPRSTAPATHIGSELDLARRAAQIRRTGDPAGQAASRSTSNSPSPSRSSSTS